MKKLFFAFAATCMLFATGVSAQEPRNGLFLEVGFGSSEVFKHFGSLSDNYPYEQSAKTAMNVDLGIGLSFKEAFFVKLNLLGTGSTLYPAASGYSNPVSFISDIKENSNLMYTNIELGKIYKIGSLRIRPAVNLGLVIFSNEFDYISTDVTTGIYLVDNYKTASYGFGSGFSVTADYALNKYLSVFAKGSVMGTTAPDTDLNEDLNTFTSSYEESIDKEPIGMISCSIGLRCNF